MRTIHNTHTYTHFLIHIYMRYHYISHIYGTIHTYIHDLRQHKVDLYIIKAHLDAFYLVASVFTSVFVFIFIFVFA